MRTKIKRRLIGSFMTLALFASVFGSYDGQQVRRVSADSGDLITVHIQVTHDQASARNMLDAINAFRQGDDAWAWDENNQKVSYTDLLPLEWDYSLEKTAMVRAMEIAVSYSHTRPNGESCFTAFDSSFDNSYRGENIAVGYSSAESVFEAWQETQEDYSGQGHRRNMLHGSFAYIGIAHVNYQGIDYWVQDFSSQSSDETEMDENNTTDIEEVIISQDNLLDLSLENMSYSLQVGESVDVSNLKLQAKINGFWSYLQSYCVLEDAFELIPEDNRIVSVADGELKAIAPGSTNLVIDLLGKRVQIEVTVSEADTVVLPTQSPMASDAQTTAVPDSDLIQNPTPTPDQNPTPTPDQNPTPTPDQNPASTSTQNQVSASMQDLASTHVNNPTSTSDHSVVQSGITTKKITLKKVTGVKVTQKKKTKKATIRFQKVSNATGYQVVYARNKSFTKQKKSKTTKTTSMTIGGLKHKKVYYVKVRAYYIDSNGIKHYGSYSKIIKRKIK